MSFSKAFKKLLNLQPRKNDPRVTVNKSGIGSGLKSIIYAQSDFDSITKKRLSIGLSTIPENHKNGTEWHGNANTNVAIDIGASGGIGTVVDQTKPWSLACRVYVNTTSALQIICGDYNAYISNISFRLVQNSDNTWRVETYNTVGALINAVAGGTVTVGYHDIFVYFSGGTNFNVSMWVNGDYAATSSNATVAMHAGGNFRWMAGGLYNLGNGFRGRLVFGAIFQGDKSDYAKKLAVNPWQLFIDAGNDLFFSIPAAISLGGSAQSASSASGSISSQLALAGASVSASTATGLLTSVMELSGVSAAGSVANGNLLISLAMSGAAIAAAAGVGQLLMEQSLAGASQAQASATGAIEGGSDLSGSATSQTLGSGDLASAMPLAGDAVSNSVSSGAITVDSGMSGAAVAGAAATGALTLSMTLSGASVASALAAAGLTAVQPLDGSAQGGAIASGDLSSLSAGDLAGNSQSAAAAAGQLFIAVPMNGAATAYASGAGNLAAIMPIAGASAAVVNAAGDLTVELNINLAGNALSQVLAGGDIRISMPMSGAALAEAIAQAALSTDADNVAVYDPRYDVGSDDDRQLNYFVMALLRNYEVSA